MSYTPPDTRAWIQKKRFILPIAFFAVGMLSVFIALPLGKTQADRDRAAALRPTVTTVTVSQPPVTETTTVTRTPSATSRSSSSSARTSYPQYSSPPRTSGSAQGGAYYANCTEVWDDDAAPLRRGDPGYRSGLDPDGDGIACEI